MPPLAAARSSTIGARDPSGGAGHEEDRLFSEGQSRASVGGRLFDEGESEPVPVFAADLDRARVGERLFDERVRHGRGGRVRRDVHDLDERLRALAHVGLRESGHAAAERRLGGPSLSEAAAHARRRDEEWRLRPDRVVEDPHRRV